MGPSQDVKHALVSLEIHVVGAQQLCSNGASTFAMRVGLWHTAQLILAHIQVPQSWHLYTPAGWEAACQVAPLAVEAPQAVKAPL